MLFEVLSGASPRWLHAPGNSSRLAEGTQWRRPSDLASSLQLRMQLRGDYDAIVAKATQTDPARRYIGAADLLEDGAGRHGRVDAAKGRPSATTCSACSSATLPSARWRSEPSSPSSWRRW
ncbi:MAG: hypothetical protein U1F25_19335 [Rubrivivax sp.]